MRDLLAGKKAEYHYSNQALAQAIGKSTNYISTHLQNPGEFKVSEAAKLCELLDIDLADMHLYFLREGE